MDELAKRALWVERRAASRLLSLIEDDQVRAAPYLKMLYRAGHGAHVLGFTGPPGAGKSTLIDLVLQAYRAAGLTVGVLAVDPGGHVGAGAILGDRVRMNRHSGDDGVYIRSMSARGALGGVSIATADALVVLDAMGFDRLIVETVGVGQNEIEIMSHADTVAVVQTPHVGDEIQLMKSGLLEIADILIVNKMETGDADHVVNAFLEFSCRRRGDGWAPPALKTCATTGQGAAELVAAVDSHRSFVSSSGADRRRRRVLAHMTAIGEAGWRRGFHDSSAAVLDEEVEDVVARRVDPYTMAAQVAQRIIAKGEV